MLVEGHYIPVMQQRATHVCLLELMPVSRCIVD